MKILFLGFSNPDHASAFMVKGFRALGHTVTHIDPYLPEYAELTALSEVYTDEDFVYVFHNNSHRLRADVPVPVVYYHYELLWRASIDECDLLIMSTPLVENGLVYWFPEIFKRNPAKYIQYPGIDLERFDARGKKKYLECSFMGHVEWKEKCWIEKDIYKTRKRVVEACEKYLDLMPHNEYEEYIKNLKHSQATLIVHGRQCYISQRIFEAAAASVCPIIYVDDEIGEKIYDDLKLFDGINCIKLYDPHDLQSKLHTYNLLELGRNARKWVETRDNIHNCQEVINYVQKYQKYMENHKKQCSLRATRRIERTLRIDVSD